MTTEQRELAREQLLTGLLSAEAHVLRGDAPGVALVALRNLKLAEQADDPALRAMSSVGVGFVAEVGGLHRLSDRLLRRSARYLRGIKDPRAELEYLRISGLVLIGRGEIAGGEAQLVEALRCADELDADELRLFVRSVLTISAALHGDCGRTRERARALTQAAGPSQHPQYLSAGWLYQALAALRAGDLADAAVALDAAAAQHLVAGQCLAVGNYPAFVPGSGLPAVCTDRDRRHLFLVIVRIYCSGANRCICRGYIRAYYFFHISYTAGW